MSRLSDDDGNEHERRVARPRAKTASEFVLEWRDSPPVTPRTDSHPHSNEMTDKNYKFACILAPATEAWRWTEEQMAPKLARNLEPYSETEMRTWGHHNAPFDKFVAWQCWRIHRTGLRVQLCATPQPRILITLTSWYWGVFRARIPNCRVL